jgi:hypothetical protein
VLLERRAPSVAEQAPDLSERDRGPASERRHHRLGFHCQLLVGHDARDEPPRHGFGGVEDAAADRQLLGTAEPDQPRQEPRRATVATEAEPRERDREDGALGGEHQVGDADEPEPAAGDRALHHGDDRHLERGEAHERLMIVRHHLLERRVEVAGASGEVREVPADGERRTSAEIRTTRTFGSLALASTAAPRAATIGRSSAFCASTRASRMRAIPSVTV